MKTQQGFSHVIILVAVVMVAIIGFAGWRVYDASKSENNNTASNTIQKTEVQDASIETVADVTAAEQELNAINIDTELDTTALDADIKELQ